ncbi:LuxR C-terminal-related transcriptional regulator [Lacisediminimonas sp.]|uniref:LuxR C-terminal-related transcriptional regulator n=1 Tax=Lacisediminimonas sp. TaxID=3060582 RepID=UPI00271C7156|nr:LuxR C-terminal-related transcriptional regulator [Lacisediminimonas sp.]MDO8301390.1 LuxR C-terminal-related transcriptional regulator [Lacisediminimonas sp.]
MNAVHVIDFESIFRNAPIGMCVSENRVIQASNLFLANMFGYPAESLCGLSFSVLYPSTDEFERTGARIVPIMNALGHYSDERIMKRANGELFWCHVTGKSMIRTEVHAAGIWTFEDLSAKRPVTAALPPREREIAALLVEGKTSKQIGRQVGLSPRTVEMHRAKLMRKFCAATSSELVNRLLGVARGPAPITGATSDTAAVSEA